ncbi:hypothetical protein FKW44_021663, partial [Caligus rogercresseyi]
RIKEYEERLSQIEDARDVVSLEINTCDALRDDIQLIDRLDLDCRKLQEEINRIKDYKTVKEEEEAVSDELNRIRSDIETDQATEMRQQKLLNDISTERNALTEEKLKLEALQQERSNIEARREEFEGLIAEHQRDLGELSSSQIEPLEEEITLLQEEKNKLTKSKAKETEGINKRLEKLKNFIDQLQYIHEAILEYEESDNETKFQKFIASQEKISK